MKPFRAIITTIVITSIVIFMLLGIFLPGSKPKPQVDVKAAPPQNSTLPPETAVDAVSTAKAPPNVTSDTQEPKQDPFHLKLPNDYSVAMTGLEYGNYANYSIRHSGKVVWRSPVPADGAESHYSVYNNQKNCPDTVLPGEDITGNGSPNLVVSNWSGGVHCCYTFQIFELGPKFRLIQTINVGDAGESHFEKRGDTVVFVTYDYIDPSGNILGGSFADTPHPEVILHYSNGKYRLAVDLMRKPPPSRETLLELSKKSKIR
jgi:hypothetical protein